MRLNERSHLSFPALRSIGLPLLNIGPRVGVVFSRQTYSREDVATLVSLFMYLFQPLTTDYLLSKVLGIRPLFPGTDEDIATHVTA